jgi:hypothetical protein
VVVDSEFGEITLRIRLEFGDAGAAAKLYFLTLVVEGNWGTHGTELVAGDEAGVLCVGLGGT